MERVHTDGRVNLRLLYNAEKGGKKAMTDTEKLDHLLMKMQEMQEEVHEIKMDVSGLKGDVSDLKTDVSGLKGDVSDLKMDVSGLKEEVSTLTSDMKELKRRTANLERTTSELKNDLSAMRIVLEKEIKPQIQIIAENHVDLRRKLQEYEKYRETEETYRLKVMSLTSDMKVIKERACCLKGVFA